MEDDDEFGDLYTDVLRPFASSAPPPHQTAVAPPPSSLRRPIDLNNLENDDEDDEGNGGSFSFEAPTSSIPGLASSQTLAPARPDSAAAASSFLGGAAGGSSLKEEDVTFDIEEGNLGVDEEGSRRDDGDGVGGGDDDWDSDESEDDLQIVLNGPVMERGDGMEDEDGDDELVIVADGDPNQAIEDQDWGEDATTVQGGDGKEAGEGGKVGAVAVPKVGYGSQGYHPFHSQFKYVRPGAQTIPGAATSGPGGVPGQVRPLANMGLVAGRGRGDWRPMGLKNGAPMQKNFHSGFTAWGGNAAGRGFGGGSEFTLPSHKTIFDIDIDGFEEKMWKYPGADTSDFFNFGFSEDSWKDYCKQLEQHRLESTMQSKIRVYESGRAEQEYDPDLPPELAAATGLQEVSPEIANPMKSEAVQTDLPKGSARLRPPLPTGRAIQVEVGYGERLPSIDTRPPRVRDSDAIIEIVLQDSQDDEASAEDGVPSQPDDIPKEAFGGTSTETEISPMDSEYVDKYPQIATEQKREQIEQRIPVKNSVGNKIPDRDGGLPFPPEPPVRNGESCEYVSEYPDGDLSPEEERKPRGLRRRSPHMSPSRNAREERYLNDEPEDSIESMDSKRSRSSSPATRKDAHETSVEFRDGVDDQDDAMIADGRSGGDKHDSPSNTITVTDTLEDVVTKKQKLKDQLEDSLDQEPDDGDDSRAARSSDNSRARSGSSRDYMRRRDGVEDEVIQRNSNRMGNVNRHFDDKEQGINHRRSRDGRQNVEKNRTVLKGREDSYPYREFDPNAVPSLMRPDGFERRKERDNSDGAWKRRDDDPYGRRIRPEETRKRERGDDIGSRHWSKVRESERVDKDDLIHPRKQMDNGITRVHYDKDMGPRNRERDDNLKARYEYMDDYHGKRKIEEEHVRREYAEKDEILHDREITNRRKRERDEVLDQRKRDGPQRLRDNIDDHQSVRQKDESWVQRERGERGRERAEWQKVKQSHEENIPKRERDEGRGITRGGRSSEDKVWGGNPKVKDESKGSDKDYQHKEPVRHGEPSKRRDRAEDESSNHGGRDDLYARGNQLGNGERRSRQERPRNDRSVTSSNDHKFHDKKHNDNTRRNRESEGGDNNSLFSSKSYQEDNGGQTNETGLKGSIDQGFGEPNATVPRQSSKRQKEDASDDEERQQDLRRGRSKLERWTSHTERDFTFKSKSSSTLKLKETDRSNNTGSLESSKVSEPSNPMETVDTLMSVAEERDSTDLDGKDADTRPDDRRMDAAEKLKKRSERFRLPLPSDKEAPTIKKVESEPVAPTKTGTLVDSEVKQERPARKRRWISS